MEPKSTKCLAEMHYNKLRKIAIEAGIRIHEIDLHGPNARCVIANACRCRRSELSKVGINPIVPAKVNGFIISASGTPHIFLDRNTRTELQWWVFAHEFGHYLLRHHEQTPPLEEHMNLAREASANWLAAQILIPTKLIWELVHEYGSNALILARLFGVSKKSITRRFNEIGIIKMTPPQIGQYIELSIYPWDNDGIHIYD